MDPIFTFILLLMNLSGTFTKYIYVDDKMDWLEAQSYCQQNYTDLAPVSTEKDVNKLQEELSKHNTTQNVWIGLRFLPGNWLWVDGQEMDYKAWGQGGKPICPQPNMKCGALQVTGANKGAWEAHDCEERLHFVCY
uniref:C-type lectin domain-containing protein n=1 Tax=Oreochromis aureus TaxID=47969 RepID=A0AAZ1XFH6_OREAU